MDKKRGKWWKIELYDFLNITNNDIEKEIIESIMKTKQELKGLAKERTCMIYSSYIYNYLRYKNIICRIIDTQEDLKMNYQHRFVLVPKNEKENYIIDVTYTQFKEDETFEKLYQKGYQLVSQAIYQKYLDNIENSNKKGVSRWIYL